MGKDNPFWENNHISGKEQNISGKRETLLGKGKILKVARCSGMSLATRRFLKELPHFLECPLQNVVFVSRGQKPLEIKKHKLKHLEQILVKE